MEMTWKDAFTFTALGLGLLALVAFFFLQVVGCERERLEHNAKTRQMLIDAAKDGKVIYMPESVERN